MGLPNVDNYVDKDNETQAHPFNGRDSPGWSLCSWLLEQYVHLPP
jgi:hypothetical protein